jgi:hypothetical protein
MAYCLLLRYDSDGLCPVLLRDDERLDGNGARARYRFVASTESWAEAKAIMDLVCKAMEARELSLGEILGLAGEAVQRAVGR